ncbi:phosphatase PAP2 family protein [Paenibacillus sp. GCM10027626]|uniref:phosphatase PAP2 family protein n=1 Tax=Paenibacillus sp. GCM10027626 TaxID=3273411 RepID=UPI0036423314
MKIIGWLLALAGFFGWAALATHEKLVDFDLSVIETVQGWENDTLTSVMKIFTFLGSSKGVMILAFLAAVILFLVLRHRMELVLLIGSVGGVAVLNEALKMLYQRNRPELHRLIEETGFSFPSGHSMAAFTFYAVLAFLLWRHTKSLLGRLLLVVLAAVMIVMIGLSRVYLGVHFPSDIIGGYWISACWTWVCLSAFRQYKGKRRQNQYYVMK